MAGDVGSKRPPPGVSGIPPGVPGRYPPPPGVPGRGVLPAAAGVPGVAAEGVGTWKGLGALPEGRGKKREGGQGYRERGWGRVRGLRVEGDGAVREGRSEGR